MLLALFWPTPEYKFDDGSNGKMTLYGSVYHHSYNYLTLTGFEKEWEYIINLSAGNAGSGTLRYDSMRADFYPPGSNLSVYTITDRTKDPAGMGTDEPESIGPAGYEQLRFVILDHNAQLFQKAGRDATMKVQFFYGERVVGSFNATIPALVGTPDANGVTIQTGLAPEETRNLVFTPANLTNPA